MEYIDKTRFAASKIQQQKAEQCIPMASQTFSKSALAINVDQHAIYLEHGQGCHVTDIDGNQYIDFMMGLLPIVLGYCDPDVDLAIKNQLAKGITFSMPAKIESELAELLIDLIPCAEMVRFAKNGSDVTSAAIRVARSYTGREHVAVCGYHGWHDWYVSGTTRDAGIPKAVTALTHRFEYNNLDSLEQLLQQLPDQVAAVILEPVAAIEPSPGFLAGVRQLCSKHGIVLVFDEIVTGFRIEGMTAQKKYGVTPDLCCMGKAMANGMPVAALMGQATLMQECSKIFFSGTFFGEALSLAASIATLNKLQAIGFDQILPEHIAKTLQALKEINQSNNMHNIISFKGVSWRPIIDISTKDKSLKPKLVTLFRQLCLKHGLLLGGGMNFAYAHLNELQQESLFAAWHSITNDFAKYSVDESVLNTLPIQESVFDVRKSL